MAELELEACSGSRASVEAGRGQQEGRGEVCTLAVVEGDKRWGEVWGDRRLPVEVCRDMPPVEGDISLVVEGRLRLVGVADAWGVVGTCLD